MLNYEACVILNALLPEAETDALISKLQSQLVSGGAQVREVARWGKRRLAYRINKADEGFYVVYFFNLPSAGEVLGAFERVCKYDDNVLRCMILNVPVKKKKQEVPQIVPQPGWLSDFSMKLRPHFSRRRSEGYEREPRPVEPEAPAPESAGSSSAPDAGAKQES